MNRRFHAALFDLDGTLLNTLEDLAASVNAALSQFGYPPRSADEVRRFLGNGAVMLIEQATPHDATARERAAVLEAFQDHYAVNMRVKTRPYDGILATLDGFLQRGLRLAVVSNKFHAAVGPLVADYFGGRITVAIGEGDGVPKKPDPTGALRALERLGCVSAQALYVGDSDVDIQTARNAGVFAVGCAWGFRDRSVLERAGADYIVDSPSQLLTLLDENR